MVEQMGCGSSSPAEVEPAEGKAEPGPPAGGGDLRSQASASTFDLGNLPKKTFTNAAPKRVGGR